MNPLNETDNVAYTHTRRALHGVAELLMAGPQFRRAGTIRLCAVEGGFATTAQPWAAVDGHRLLVEGRTVGMLWGTTYAELAAAAGLDAGAPDGVYATGSGMTGSGMALSDVIRVDPQHARVVAAAFDTAEKALRVFAPSETPVLWPEHFDLGIATDEVNYGVSAGDDHIAEPYAYVGPWSPRRGEFWNQPFGAARTMTELQNAAGVFDFFSEGLRLARQ
jgi:hypothetical protein